MVKDLKEIREAITEMRKTTEGLKKETKDPDRDLWYRRKEKESRKSVEFSFDAKSFLSSLGPKLGMTPVVRYRICSSTDSLEKPNEKYETKCFVKSKMVPVNFSSTVSVKLGTTRKKFTEEITFENRFISVRYSEKMETMQRFASRLEIECRPTKKTVVQLKHPFIYQDLILPLDKRSPVFI